jgi:hypothetical protein
VVSNNRHSSGGRSATLKRRAVVAIGLDATVSALDSGGTAALALALVLASLYGRSRSALATVASAVAATGVTLVMRWSSTASSARVTIPRGQ